MKNVTQISNRSVAIALLFVVACGPPPPAPSTSISTSSEPTGDATALDSTADHTSGEVLPTSGTMQTSPATSHEESETGNSSWPSPPCEVWDDQCPTGQKCIIYWDDPNLDGMMGCVDIVDDPDDIGETCNGFIPGESLDTCADNQMCAGGRCRGFCTGSVDPEELTCPENYLCGFSPPVYAFCTYLCDPLINDCPPGERCARDEPWMICIEAGPTTALFGACFNDNECPSGQFCAAKETAAECMALEYGCCVEFCDLSAPACSGVGQGCVAYYPEDTAPLPKLENLGFCTLP